MTDREVVWGLHFMHNYEECNNKESFLHKLIPHEGVFNGKCYMYYKHKEPKAVGQMQEVSLLLKDNATLRAKLEEAERERDAVVEDIETVMGDSNFNNGTLCQLCLEENFCAETRECNPKWHGIAETTLRGGEENKNGDY